MNILYLIVIIFPFSSLNIAATSSGPAQTVFNNSFSMCMGHTLLFLCMSHNLLSKTTIQIKIAATLGSGSLPRVVVICLVTCLDLCHGVCFPCTLQLLVSLVLFFFFFKLLFPFLSLAFQRVPWISIASVSSVQFSRSVASDSLRPHESQHARPSCPSPTPGVHSDSRPSSQ